MANFVLDVSRIPEGSAAAVAYRCASIGTTQNHIDLTPTADSLVLGVVMDNLDAAKVLEGAPVDVRVMGIAPICLGTGGASPGNRLAVAADGKVIVSATAAAAQVGIALQTGTAGGIIDVLLTPGVKIGA